MVDESPVTDSPGIDAASTGHARPTDEDVFRRFPRVRLDQVNIEYYRALLVRHLTAGWCRNCERWHTPLRPICPSCWTADVTVRQVEGKGTVHLLTRLYQGPPIVDYSPPWPLAAVELAEQEGLRIVAPLVDTPEAAQRIGQSVELVWIDRDGTPWPAFRATTAGTEVSR
ncbi:Zn-ribbon domain-containing OB-fold protein [Nocardia sp. alder85J]|uniref:Zn-ribbon domain-containing OB-fold protein n=1 Tax=Nocardia sp. alder85J TaxID=2862949 RepID=UPI001CD353A1|nr:OB-fold domain-containing protein [Nocardia sp. alder85J]MCX4095760.1 OB-fold domain-containing protein [Nocardia sp. alder85J]